MTGSSANSKSVKTRIKILTNLTLKMTVLVTAIYILMLKLEFYTSFLSKKWRRVEVPVLYESCFKYVKQKNGLLIILNHKFLDNKWRI